MGVQLNVVKISNYIKSNNYNIDSRTISLLGRIEFDNSSDLRELNYSAGRMYFKARDERALEHLINAVNHFEDNKTIIEINMMIGVHFLRRKQYNRADRYFMACYPLMPDDFEFEGDKWPWEKEETSSLDVSDRIDLYKFLYPYFDHIDVKIYFVSLLFQLRCNETVQLLRKGYHQKALSYFDALFDSMPYLNMKKIEGLRIDFMEKKGHNLRIQVFDMATLFHYQAITHWSLSDFNIAKSIFYECMDYREDNGHYLDLSGTYSNIAMVNNNLQKYEDAIKFFEKSLELISKFGEKEDLLPNYINLIRTYQLKFDFKNALISANKAVNIAVSSIDTYTKVKILQHQSLSYFYLKNFKVAISINNKCLELTGNIDDPNVKSNILYNLILAYNRTNQFDNSIRILNKLELMKNKNINNIIMAEYYVAKMDFNIFQGIIDESLYNQLLELIQNNYVEKTIFETAILQLINVDTQTSNFKIFEISTIKKSFYANLVKLSNPSIIYHLDLVAILKLNQGKLEKLREKIKLDVKMSLDIRMKKLMKGLLLDFNKILVPDLIKNNKRLIDYNLNYRYHEIKL